MSHFDVSDLGTWGQQIFITSATYWPALSSRKGSFWLGQCTFPNPDLSSFSPKSAQDAKWCQEIWKLYSKLSFLIFLKTNFHLNTKVAHIKVEWGWGKGGEKRHIIKRNHRVSSTQKAETQALRRGRGKSTYTGPRGSTTWAHNRHVDGFPDIFLLPLPSAHCSVSNSFPKCSSLFYNCIL